MHHSIAFLLANNEVLRGSFPNKGGFGDQPQGKICGNMPLFGGHWACSFITSACLLEMDNYFFDLTEN